MGIKRIVDISFWTDSKIDEFTPEDKYFMLYLLTNPFTTQLGIYEISIKQVAFQLGYSIESVKSLIDRFENKYKIIIFSKETNEIAILNYLRHSIIKGGAPVRDCLIKEMKAVKAKHLIADVFSHLQSKINYEEINVTVRNIIEEYCKNDINVSFNNESYHESYNDTSTNRTTNRARYVNESYHNENENENENENDNDNDNDYIEPLQTASPSPKKPTRHKYGEYQNVLLSDADLEKLKAEFPTDYESRIERLSEYIASTGKTYKNHLATIRNWAKRDTKDNLHNGNDSNGLSFDVNSFFNQAVQNTMNKYNVT